MDRIAAGFALAYAALAGAMAPAAAQTNGAPPPLAKRPLTVDDVLGLQQLGDVVPSPNGKELAVVIKRAHTTRESYLRDNLDDDDHADIWSFPAEIAKKFLGLHVQSGSADAISTSLKELIQESSEWYRGDQFSLWCSSPS